MSKILEGLYTALAASVALAVLMFLYLHGDLLADSTTGQMAAINAMIWLHVVAGILWIGLLWYFNMVQIPTMPKIPPELKPAIGKFIAPNALFWFRWSALATVVTGLAVAFLRGYLHEALALQMPARTIGIGMWLALIMAFNVWFIIWPNQKKALGIVATDDAAKAKSARIAMLTSRANFVLSLPMLYCMVSQNIAG
ncbi:MAG: urate hydroxylase PuuD [Alphaproteobacteria bacterium]